MAESLTRRTRTGARVIRKSPAMFYAASLIFRENTADFVERTEIISTRLLIPADIQVTVYLFAS